MRGGLAAAAAVRTLTHSDWIWQQLHVHHVGGGPLRLGPADSGVTWRSADSANPAVLGGPIRV